MVILTEAEIRFNIIPFESVRLFRIVLIIAFHDHPWLIHRFAYRRTNPKNPHVRGYKEEGTTAFDMCVLNNIDRFTLVLDVIRRVPGLVERATDTVRAVNEKLDEHRRYIAQHDIDMPEILHWRWGGKSTKKRGG